MRTEEADGYLENLLVRPVSRTSWFAERLGLSSLLLLTAGLLAGFGAWAGVASQHSGIRFGSLVTSRPERRPARPVPGRQLDGRAVTAGAVDVAPQRPVEFGQALRDLAADGGQHVRFGSAARRRSSPGSRFRPVASAWPHGGSRVATGACGCCRVRPRGGRAGLRVVCAACPVRLAGRHAGARSKVPAQGVWTARAAIAPVARSSGPGGRRPPPSQPGPVPAVGGRGRVPGSGPPMSSWNGGYLSVISPA